MRVYGHGVAFDSAGTLHVVWIEGSPGVSYATYHLEKSPGGAWSQPLQVTPSPDVTADAPAIAVGPDGRLHVLYSGGLIGVGIGGVCGANSPRSPATQGLRRPGAAGMANTYPCQPQPPVGALVGDVG